MCFALIYENAFAFQVAIPQQFLRFYISLLGRFAPPTHSLTARLGNIRVKIFPAQVVLCFCIPLFCAFANFRRRFFEKIRLPLRQAISFIRPAVPAHRLDLVLSNAQAMFICSGQLTLCLRVYQSGRAIPMQRRRYVFGNALADLICAAQVILCFCIPLFGSLLVPTHCFALVDGNTLTEFVVTTQCMLCFYMILRSGFAIPPH